VTDAAWDTLARIRTTATLTTGLLGVAAKYVLLPWLRDHLGTPLDEVHKQVAENGHQHPNGPTLPDRIDQLSTDVAQLSTDVRAVVRVVDSHLEFSDRWVRLTERELDQLRRDQENGGHSEDSTT
jgi:hypothetical protein